MNNKQLITLSLLVHAEKKIGKGEDGYVCVSGGANAALIACLDGCGGAGSRVYEKANHKTGARLAAHHVGSTIRSWFISNRYDQGLFKKTPAELSQELKTAIDHTLHHLCENYDTAEQSIRSKSIRTFPTTLAMVIPEVIDVNTVRCISFWAGDSRTYVFPVSGLIQTSMDDVRGNGDPFTVLEKDGILSNVISASVPYQINVSEATVHEPCMILSATDGCFSYFCSPMEFEWLLLDTMMAAETPAQWENNLLQALGNYASDDYTLGIAVIGFRNWEAVKTAYFSRWNTFRSQYHDPLTRILAQEDRQAHLELWQQYKQSYMATLAD